MASFYGCHILWPHFYSLTKWIFATIQISVHVTISLFACGMFKLHHYMIYLVYAPKILGIDRTLFSTLFKKYTAFLSIGVWSITKVNVFREITFHHLEHMPFRVSHSTTFSRISLTKMYLFSTTPWGYDERYIQFFQNCITLQIFLEKCETLIDKVMCSLKKISSHHLDQKLKLQWYKCRNCQLPFSPFLMQTRPLNIWYIETQKDSLDLGHCS